MWENVKKGSIGLVVALVGAGWIGCSGDGVFASRKSADAEDGGYAYPYDTAGWDGDEGENLDALDTGGGYVPPEEEETSNFLKPKGAGRYVFIPDESRDAVVIVDSETLLIQVVEVGSRPTHLVPLEDPDHTTVAVINLNSDEVTIIRMDEDENIETLDLPVRPDTNALAPSPDGRFIIAYHDPQLTEQSGTPGTDQEISVLDLTPGRETAFERTVGQHPWKIVYNQDVTSAFVVTEGGINVVDLTALDSEERSDPVTLFEHGSYDSRTADIEITPDGAFAVGRKDNSPEIKVVALDGSEAARSYIMSAIPTDLDIAADGSFGSVVMRTIGSVAFFDLPLPEDAAADPFTYVSLEGRIAGVASISSDGDQLLLHTTVATQGDDQRRLTLMSRTEDGWEIDSAVLERDIKEVILVEESSGRTRTAVVLHTEIPAGPGIKPFAYTLVTLPTLMTKLQQTAVEPTQLIFTSEGDFGYLLLGGAYAVEKMDLETLIVNTLDLSSKPFAGGFAADTNKVFIAQDHPAGRMTFFDVYDETVRTVTGFNLNDEIEISEQ